MSNSKYKIWTVLDRDKDGKPCLLQPVVSMLRLSNISPEEYEKLINEYAIQNMNKRGGEFISELDKFYARFNIMRKYFPSVKHKDGITHIRIPGREN